MARATFLPATYLPGAGLLDFATSDIRAILTRTSSTIETEPEVDKLSDFTALDEYDGAGYVRMGVTGKAWTANPGTVSSFFSLFNTVWTALSFGTTAVAGALLYLHLGADTVNAPLGYFYGGSQFPASPDGTDFTVQWPGNAFTYTALP